MVPFVTSWMGENHFSATPVAVYGVVMLMNAVAFTILTRVLIAHHGKDSTLARALGSDHKGKISLLLYAAAIPLACVEPRLALAIYVFIAMVWFLPDRRIEKAIDPEARMSSTR